MTGLRSVRGYWRRLSHWPGVRSRLAGSVAVSVSLALLDGLGLGLLIPLFSQIQGPAGGPGAVPGLWGRALSAVSAHTGIVLTLPVLLALSAAVSFSRARLDYFRQLSFARNQCRFLEDMQTRLFRSMTDFDLGFFHRSRMGDLVSVLTVEAPRAAFSIHLMMEMMTSLCLMGIYLSIQLYLSWWMTLAALATVGTVAYFIRPRRTYQRGLDQAQANGDIQSTAFETFSGIREIKALGLGPRVQERFQKVAGRLHEVFVDMTDMSVRFIFWYQCAVVVVVTGVYLGSREAGLSLPALFVFLIALQRMAPQMQSFVDKRHWWLSSLPALERVEGTLEETHQARTAVPSGSAAFEGLERGLSFEGVSFQYPGREKESLSDVSFSVGRGEIVALVGSSGAGKSTLLDLLARFYDPAAGAIQVDGRDLRQMILSSWRAGLGLVSQDTFLFNDTILENIRFGRLDATPEEIQAAAREAHIHDFIAGLPQGYETRMQDRGVTLSGGQRQRVSLARVFLRRPHLLLLDEATSDLDAESEAKIQAAINGLRGRTTVVMSAHRLATVKLADRVIVLEEGRIVEQGAPAELLARRGRFAILHKLQFGENS